MANLLTESRKLQDRFVYYKRLKSDGEAMNKPALTQLYNSIMAQGNAAIGVKEDTARAERIIATLRKQATVEATKEARLLNEKFKCDVQVGDMLTKDIGKQITLLMNDALQLQGIFQRNVDRILGDKTDTAAAKTTITSVLDSYVIQEFRTSWTTLLSHIWKEIAKNPDRPPEEAVDEVFNSPYVNKIVDRALNKALNSATWKGGDDNPFKELLDFLDRHSDRRQRLVAAMWENLGINKLRDALKEEVASQADLKAFKNRKGGMSKLDTTIKSGMRRGIMAEVFGEITSQAARELKGQNFNTTFDTSVQTGGYEAKADVIITFDVNIDQILSKIEKYSGADRKTNKKRFEDINNYLKKIKSGFVVYSSAKDYTLIKKTGEFGGFSAGSPITLRRYQEVMRGTKSRDFVGAVANTIDGAVFEGQKYRNALTEYLAQDIGSLLFDGMKITGDTKSGAQTIHLLDLNGVYIPLSYLMLLLAEAFEQETKNKYKDLFKAQITRREKIAYPDGGEGQEGEYKWTYEDWKRQRDRALDSITISAKFLKNFEEIVRELMK